MKEIDEILSEDVTYQQGLTSAMDWTSKTVPSNVSLTDILRMSNTQFSQTGGMVNFPNELSNIENHLKKIISDTQGMMNVYKQALGNPIIKNDNFKTHIVQRGIENFESILKKYKSVYDDLRHLVLESE